MNFQRLAIARLPLAQWIKRKRKPRSNRRPPQQTTAAADLLQGTGDTLEATSYGQASTLAEQNAAYTTAATNISLAQGQRQIYQTIGGVKAGAAGSGLTTGGTAGDILRMSAQQGALNQAVTPSQGQIQVAEHQEQAQSYTAMQQSAELASQEQTFAAQGEQDVAAGYEDVASGFTQAASYSTIGAVISGIGAVASLFDPLAGGATNPTGPTSGSYSGIGGWTAAAPGL